VLPFYAPDELIKQHLPYSSPLSNCSNLRFLALNSKWYSISVFILPALWFHDRQYEDDDRQHFTCIYSNSCRHNTLNYKKTIVLICNASRYFLSLIMCVPEDTNHEASYKYRICNQHFIETPQYPEIQEHQWYIHCYNQLDFELIDLYDTAKQRE
jgi:hypothetical protein